VRAVRPALAAAALALVASAPGCLTFVWSRQGNPIDPAAVAAIESGRTTFSEVLDHLGAPLEVHAHADGRLLVYRHAARNTFRIGLDLSRATTLVDASRVVSEAAGNLKLTIERIHEDEDRVVVLVGRDDIVRAVGYRAAVAGLPTF